MKVKVRKVSNCDLALAGLDIYLAARQLNYLPALNLARQACSEEERNFFAYIADMNLQRTQWEHIAASKLAQFDREFAVDFAYNSCGMEGNSLTKDEVRSILDGILPDRLLVPSQHGKDCPGNGEHPGIECQCDNCDHFLFCFPDWEERKGQV